MKKRAVTFLIFCGFLMPGLAVSNEGPYVGAAGLYVEPDDDRESDWEHGAQLRYGLPLSVRNLSFELDVTGYRLERQVDGNPDYVRALTGNLTYWIPLGSKYHDVRLFGTAGAGFVEDDLRGSSDLEPGLTAGLGALVPVHDNGLAVRIEARGLRDMNRLPTGASGDDPVDLLFSLGLQVPLAAFFGAAAPVEPEDCDVAVVGLKSRRKDCESDADADGVVDAMDQCPGTPLGSSVDADGCMRAAVDDGDGDGISDDTDLCPGTPQGSLVDEAGCAMSLVLKGVNFETGSARLTAAAQSLLDDMARALNAQPRLRVEIAGHTDNQGDNASNQDLSMRRANAVLTYLVSAGVSANRLLARGYGSLQPMSDNVTAEGRAQNRRVELRPLPEN